jgi:hypothetical protein
MSTNPDEANDNQRPGSPESPTPQRRTNDERVPPTPSSRPSDTKKTRSTSGPTGTLASPRREPPIQETDYEMGDGARRNIKPLPARVHFPIRDKEKQDRATPTDDPFRSLPFPESLLNLTLPERREENPHLQSINSNDFPPPENTKPASRKENSAVSSSPKPRSYKTSPRAGQRAGKIMTKPQSSSLLELTERNSSSRTKQSTTATRTF